MTSNLHATTSFRARFLLAPIAVLACFLLLRPVFLTVGLRWLYITLFSSALSASLTPFSRWLAFRTRALDRPGGHKIHHTPTPLLGGIPIVLGFSLPLLINAIFSLELSAILFAAFVLFVVGLIDDVKYSPASLKLLIQTILAVGLTFCGIRVSILPEAHTAGLLVNAFVTVVWIVGITNAVNFFDGMDGLAAGLGSIIAFFMALVALRMDTPSEGWAALAMMGACLGFLPFNFRPGQRATIFLGDAGSTVIGFVLASLAIYASWADLKPIVSLTSPLLIFGILIFDMCYITWFRIAQGKVRNFHQWLEYVGHDHLHHRLACVLGSRAKSVLFIYILTVCLGINALLLPHAHIEDALILLGQATLILVLVSILERKGRALAERGLRTED